MPSVDDEAIPGQLTRLASVNLPSHALRPGNVDLSSSGYILLQTEDTIYILIPALNHSSLLKPDLFLTVHQDASQRIPLFRYPITIKSCKPDTSKAGSGREAYLLNYQASNLDAKWSPTDIGPYESPVLAALTTQSQILLYAAETNQFKGPWKQIEFITGGSEHHIISMEWIVENGDSCWLLLGTRRGEVMIYNVKADKATLFKAVNVVNADIAQLYWSQEVDSLALVAGDQVLVAEVRRMKESIALPLIAHQPPSLGGSFVNLAKWQGNILIYCTPGQVHRFDASTGSYQSVLLESNEDEESCSLRPAVAITPLEFEEWEILLQDGSIYHLSADSFTKEYILSTEYLPPPNEVIGSLQRRIEAARGVFGKCDDGAGLSFTCHNDNEIASWSYHREPKCTFGLSLTKGSRSSKDVMMAAKLLEAALQRNSLHLRAFILFYTYSSAIKSELLAMSLQALQGQIETKQNLKAAFRLSIWVQNEQGKEFKDKSRGNLHERLFDLCMAQALLGRINLILGLPNPFSTSDDDKQFCTLLAKAAYCLATRLEDKELLNASTQLLTKRIKVSMDDFGPNLLLGTGELCSACGSSIAFHPDKILQAKCQKGHLWKRCATSLALLQTSYNQICSICSHESIRPVEAVSPIQRRLLESRTTCDLCSGKLFL